MDKFRRLYLLLAYITVFFYLLLSGACSILKLAHTNPVENGRSVSSDGPTNLYPQELIAYYPFNGNAKNVQGNADYDGVVLSATLTNDRFNSVDSAYLFDGTDNYIYFGLPTNSSGVYTWVFWSKDISTNISNRIWLTTTPDSQHAGQLVVGEDDTVGGTVFIRVGMISNKCMSLSAWKDGNWHMHALLSDGTNTRYYFDTALVVTIPYCEGHEDGLYAGGFTYLGSHQFFYGMIDDIRIFSNALSENELSNYFHENGW